MHKTNRFDHLPLRMVTKPPVAAIIIGSGLADAVGAFPRRWSLPYAEIPGMPIPSVKGHGGTLHEVDVEGKHVLVFEGRSHLYEGVGTDAVLAPIYEARRRGVHHMIFTNAVGGLSPRLAIGDVMLVSEVIDLTFQGDLGIHMPPSRQSDVIDRQWRELIRSTATMRSIRFEEGTYLQVLGPSYETRAEIRMARRFHADVIGMSTAREAKAAAAFGMRVCTLSVVTNRLSDVRTPTLDHAEVVDAGKRAAPVLHNMLSTAIFAL